jgi:hypothetical protein
MRQRARPWTKLALAGVVAHHGIEFAAGIGLPGEPLLGRRRAVWVWTAALGAWSTVASIGGERWHPGLAAGNGALQALALQHYLSWPVRLHAGIPVLTSAEGLPDAWLPAYNVALLTMIASATVASAREARGAGAGWHLVGLATLPGQYASARHHSVWLRNHGR